MRFAWLVVAISFLTPSVAHGARPPSVDAHCDLFLRGGYSWLALGGVLQAEGAPYLTMSLAYHLGGNWGLGGDAQAPAPGTYWAPLHALLAQRVQQDGRVDGSQESARLLFDGSTYSEHVNVWLARWATEPNTDGATVSADIRLDVLKSGGPIVRRAVVGRVLCDQALVSNMTARELRDASEAIPAEWPSLWLPVAARWADLGRWRPALTALRSAVDPPECERIVRSVKPTEKGVDIEFTPAEDCRPYREERGELESWIRENGLRSKAVREVAVSDPKGR